MTTKASESSHTVAEIVSNIDWLRVLAFGMETPAIQSEPGVTPVSFEVLP